MLRQFLLAGMATTLTLAASGLDGNWVGLIVLDGEPSRVSLILRNNGRSISGSVTFRDDEPIAIRHGVVSDDLLKFTLHDAAGNLVRFHLKAVDGLTIGEYFHHAEGLTGEALIGDRTAEVKLPFHNTCTTPAVLLQGVQAEYSREARRAQLQGAVYLSVRIDTSGRPAEVHVIRGLGMGLDEKAVEALKKWQFQAAERAGAPVPFETVVAMKFRCF